MGKMMHLGIFVSLLLVASPSQAQHADCQNCPVPSAGASQATAASLEGPLFFFSHLLDTSDFPARWNCGTWSTDLGWLHIIADAAIAAVYFAIPIALLFFLVKRPKVPFPFLLCLFAAFILLCGSGHLMESIIFWWPAYRLAGLIKLLTAIVSLVTLVMLVPILPKALSLPDVVALNQQLDSERSHLAEEIARRKILASIIDCSSDAIFSKDQTGVISSWNRGAENLYGYTAEEVIGQKVTLIVPPDRHTEVSDILQKILQGIPIENFETIRVGKDGARRDISLSIFPLRDSSGNIFGAASISRDISQQKQLERALQHSQRRFDSLSEANIVGIMTSTVNGTVENANQEMLRILGMSLDEMRARGICWTDLLPAELQNTTHPPTHRDNSGEQLRAWESEIKRVDGSRVPVMIGITQLEEEQGMQLCFVLDITAQRAAQQAMREAKEQAEKANHAKSEFLATITHELRTPLSGVIAMTELLADTELDDDQQKFVSYCCSSGNALLALINNVLDVSKIEEGRLELNYHAFDLSAMLEDVMQTMAARVVSQKVTLSCDWDDSQRLILEGDSHRLCQILVNLIGNALKFTQEGSVTLSVVADHYANDWVKLGFSVEDTGIGISVESLEKLFQPFIQADGSTSRRFGGTGLGLTISQRLVDAMGGTIQVESALGEGSRFFFDLDLAVIPSPALIVPSQAPRLESEQPIQPEIAEQEYRPKAHCDVLIAEDNAINQVFIREMLSRKGWNCTIVPNGIEAVQLATTLPFDIILMDCQMPEMDGFRATQEIRQWEKASGQPIRIPIIGLTANAFQTDRTRCLDAGMDEYLAKPFTRVQFWELIQQYIPIQEQDHDDRFPGSSHSAERDRPAIDIDELLDRCFNDTNFLDTLLEMFERDGQQRMGLMEACLAQGDVTELRDRSHQIAGMASIVGAIHLQELSCRMENLDSTGDLEEALNLFRELKSEFTQCLDISQGWRNSLTPTSHNHLP